MTGTTLPLRTAPGRARAAWLPPWTQWPAQLLFLSMLGFPTIFQGPKAGLLALVALFVVAKIARREEPPVHRAVVLWLLVYLLLGLTFMLRGALRGEPGALAVGTVYVLWPAAFGVFLAGAPRLDDLRGFVRLLTAGTLLVSLYGLGFVLEAAGYLPGSLFANMPGDPGVGFHDGFVELRIGGLGTLVFCVPFLLTRLTCGTGLSPRIREQVFGWGVLALAGVLVGLSGRRALMLMTALSPALILPLALLLPARERGRVLPRALKSLALAAIAPVLALAIVSQRAGIDLTAVWDMFSTGFDPAQSESMSIRAVQMREILAAWSDEPLLGRGHGSFLRAHIRDMERPWTYEQSYATLLFQTGLLGLVAYGVLLLWLLGCLVAMVRRGGPSGRTALALLVGLLAFLAANATNPYLQKFDFMWVVFLPLALVNAWLLERGREARPALGGHG